MGFQEHHKDVSMLLRKRDRGDVVRKGDRTYILKKQGQRYRSRGAFALVVKGKFKQSNRAKERFCPMILYKAKAFQKLD